MMDEPTRGIDVGAKYEIYELIINMAKQGRTIIVVSVLKCLKFWELQIALALCQMDIFLELLIQKRQIRKNY